MPTLLVTGASGFVGGKLVERARASGDWTVTGVGRRLLAREDYRSIDLSQPFTLDLQPDVVVHAAARSSPWGTPAEFFRQNVTATRRVVEFCASRRKRPRLIYISSSSVFYRREHQLGLTERSPIGPEFVNTYAATKAAGEAVVREYAGSWAILRPRAVFGRGDTVLFPRILHAAAKGRLPLLVADGPPVMGDLITIDALSDYILRAAASEVTGDFNLTNNQPVPIVEFLLRVFDELGVPRPTRRMRVGAALRMAGVLEAAYRMLPFLGEPPITRFGVSVFAWSKTFDVSKSLAAFGPPSVSIDAGLHDFVRWQREQSR